MQNRYHKQVFLLESILHEILHLGLEVEFILQNS